MVSKSTEYESTHENSDNASDINEDEINNISLEAKKNYINNEFKEKVKNYLVIDDSIRKKQDEIKELKNKKKPCEEYLLKFLEKLEFNYIDINGGKLIKNESETKAPLKIDIIKEAIVEKSKNEQIFDSDDKYNQFIESIMELMDKKRPIQKRINLKRTFKKQNNLGKASKKAAGKN